MPKSYSNAPYSNAPNSLPGPRPTNLSRKAVQRYVNALTALQAAEAALQNAEQKLKNELKLSTSSEVKAYVKHVLSQNRSKN